MKRRSGIKWVIRLCVISRFGYIAFPSCFLSVWPGRWYSSMLGHYVKLINLIGAGIYGYEARSPSNLALDKTKAAVPLHAVAVVVVVMVSFSVMVIVSLTVTVTGPAPRSPVATGFLTTWDKTGSSGRDVPRGAPGRVNIGMMMREVRGAGSDEVVADSDVIVAGSDAVVVGSTDAVVGLTDAVVEPDAVVAGLLAEVEVEEATGGGVKTIVVVTGPSSDVAGFVMVMNVVGFPSVIVTVPGFFDDSAVVEETTGDGVGNTVITFVTVAVGPTVTVIGPLSVLLVLGGAAEDAVLEGPNIFSAALGSTQPTETPAVVFIGSAKHWVFASQRVKEKDPDVPHWPMSPSIQATWPRVQGVLSFIPLNRLLYSLACARLLAKVAGGTVPVDDGIVVIAVGTTRLTVDTTSEREADEDFVPEDEPVIAEPELVVREDVVIETAVLLDVKDEEVAVIDDEVVVPVAASESVERNPVTVVTEMGPLGIVAEVVKLE